MRKPVVNFLDLIRVLLTHKEEIQANLNHSSAGIWRNVSDYFDRKISAKAVYTSVKQNRADCWKALETQNAEERMDSTQVTAKIPMNHHDCIS